MNSTFRAKAPPYMHRLMKDFPMWGVLDAAACFGNAGQESSGFTKLQEIKPTVAGSRGGWGWFQWTGTRRRAFEAYCKRNNLDPASDKANYAWLFLELKTTEKKAIAAVMKEPTLDRKTEAFERSFERAGVKHYDSRKRWALAALHAYEAWIATQPGNGPPPAHVPADPVPPRLPTETPVVAAPIPIPAWIKNLWFRLVG